MLYIYMCIYIYICRAMEVAVSYIVFADSLGIGEVCIPYHASIRKCMYGHQYMYEFVSKKWGPFLKSQKSYDPANVIVGIRTLEKGSPILGPPYSYGSFPK